jgi:hypothetical protein
MRAGQDQFEFRVRRKNSANAARLEPINMRVAGSGTGAESEAKSPRPEFVAGTTSAVNLVRA